MIVSLEYPSMPWAALGGMPDKPDGDDRFITTDQLDYLLGCLRDLPHLVADLELAETKQDRFPTRPTPNADQAENLPFRPGVVAARQQLTRAVWSVAGLVWHRATAGQPNPFRTVHDAASWLAGQPKLIAQEPDAEQYAHRIADAHDRILARNGPIDRPPEQRYLGICQRCRTADLYVERGAEYVECACGWTSQVDTLLRDALRVSDDRLFTDTELVGALQLGGTLITRDQINGWARRGRLTVHEQRRWRGDRIVTVRVFRLGDVRRIALEQEQQRKTA